MCGRFKLSGMRGQGKVNRQKQGKDNEHGQQSSGSRSKAVHAASQPQRRGKPEYRAVGGRGGCVQCPRAQELTARAYE
jgi:hypothetical protein